MKAYSSANSRSSSTSWELSLDSYHMAAVDPQTRLGEWVGRLSPAEQQSVDTALLAVLALD